MVDAYPLRPFRVNDRDALCEIVRRYPLGSVVTGAAGEARQTLVPMLIDQDPNGQLTLSGHIDRNNPQTEALAADDPVAFHFVGPDSYASPDLYPDPHLPGWLYVSVQGNGEVAEVLDAEALRALLIRSTEEFGAPNQSFRLADDDPRMHRLLPYIHGFRIRVTQISGIAKLAQDKGKRHSDIALNFLADLDNGDSRELFQQLGETAT